MNLFRAVPFSLGVFVPMTFAAAVAIGRTPLVTAQQAADQKSPPQEPAVDPGIVTLRASSRLTVVDVTVIDSRGNPIQGLKSSDFHIEEDGKQQPIRHFEELRADVARPTRTPPALPPHVYTNLTPPPGSSSVNVLLLDALNTKLSDQAFVKNETLAYLKNMAPGTRVAIMTLGNQLRILQGFTQDGAILSAAVSSKNNRSVPSPLLNDDVADTNDTLSDVVDAGTAASLQEFANETNSFQTDMRNRMTMEALNQIAAYLSTIPGRKNLIWFSAGMPLQIFPTGGVSDMASMSDYTRELRRTTDLLTAAQIAVYPVDAQGLHGSTANSAVNAGGGFAGGNGGQNMAAANLKFLEQTAQEQLSMEAVAEATGGVAYYNTNGLREAVTKAVANGSNYYAVSYVPPNPAFDGAFHKIHLKVDHPGAHLAYRTGYYADDVSRNVIGGSGLTPASTPASPEISSNHMAASMRRGTPASTQILFDVRVEPTTGVINEAGVEPVGTLNPKLKDKTLKRYGVYFIFPFRQITFNETPEHVRKGALEFQVAAYDVQGTMLNSISQTVTLPLKPEAYLKLQGTPFRFYEQLDLPPGDIFLRVGIHDVTSGHVGTLEIPLTVVRKPTPPPSQPAVGPAPGTGGTRGPSPDSSARPSTAPNLSLPGASSQTAPATYPPTPGPAGHVP